MAAISWWIFDGTSPQVNWGVNVVYNFTYTYVFMAIKSALDPDIPFNEGATRPIKMTAPRVPSSTARSRCGGGSNASSHFMTEMVFRALSPAIPDAS